MGRVGCASQEACNPPFPSHHPLQSQRDTHNDNRLTLELQNRCSETVVHVSCFHSSLHPLVVLPVPTHHTPIPCWILQDKVFLASHYDNVSSVAKVQGG